MELMSISFDKFYKYVYSSLDEVIPEEILGKITLVVSVHSFNPLWHLLSDAFVNMLCSSVSFQTVKALNHLKESLKIIHRGKRSRMKEVACF